MSGLPLDSDIQTAGQETRLREVVRSLLAGNQVERVLSLWRQCQASQAHCSVPAFVDKVAGELGLDAALAGQLRVKLFAEVLARRPAVQRARVGKPAAVPAAGAAARRRVDAPSQVFVALVKALDESVRTRHGADWGQLCAALVRQLRARPVAAFQTGSLLRGDADPSELAPPVGGEAERHALVHAYYLALCEVFGPAPADRLLSDAVKQVEQLPAASRYAPRRLL